MNEETLKVKILADISDLKQGMNQVKDQLSGVEKGTGGINSGLKTLAKGMIAAFSVKAVIDFGKKIVETTAELQAMDAQFEQIFKGTEGEQALSRITAQSQELGIQGDRLKKSWNSFGGQFKGAGMEAEQSMTAVEKATRLAADSAAFYDKSLEDTSGAIASFLKGNFSAGDAIGVFTSAKQMDAKANDMYGKSWADLTEDERQWLLLDTVEKTYEMNGAMGQASREADSYENVMGNLKASWERFLAIIGAPILKVVVEVIKGITDGVTWLSEKIKNVDWNAFTGGTDIMGSLKNIATEVVNFFVENWPQIQETAAQVFSFIAQIWNETLKPAFIAIFDLVKQLWEVFKAAWPSIQTLVETAFKVIKDIWNNVLKPVFDMVVALVKTIAEKFKEHMPQIKEFFADMAEKIDYAYNNILKPVFEFIGAIVKWVADKFKEYIGPIVNFIFTVFGGIYGFISYYLGQALTFVGGAIDGIKGFFDKVGQVKDNVLGYFTDIYEGIKEKINNAKQAVSDAIDKIKSFFNFQFTWPKISMPKFSITGSMNPVKWLTEGVPKLSVQWNARGAIFKQPTILNGQGVGDASNGFGSSPEVVAPLSDLRQMLGLDGRKKTAETVINLNGNYSFRDKDDMDYFMNKLAQATRRI